MPTLTVYEIDTPDGFLVRCDQFPKWRPKPAEDIDRAVMEKQLRAHQTRATRFQWFTPSALSLNDLGFEA